MVPKFNFELLLIQLFIHVRKRPFHFCSTFSNFKNIKIDFGQFLIQFLIFLIMKKLEIRFFGSCIFVRVPYDQINFFDFQFLRNEISPIFNSIFFQFPISQ